VIGPAYQRLLGRAVDPSGLSFWLGQFHRGLTDEQFEAVLIGTQEYFNHAGGTNAAWLDALYHDVLRRPADGSGLSFWLPQLNAGLDRTSLAALFEASGEHRTLVVQDNFLRYLGRPAGAGEASFWAGIFGPGVTPELMAAILVGSDEYRSSNTVAGG
jgi:hypothetical protein